MNARAHYCCYSVSESIKGPWLCEIERLFGREPVYRYSYTAETNTSTVFIAKRELLKMCSEIDVVRLNMLNLYTGLAQKGRDRLWLQREGGTAEHITRWFKEHCLYPAGEKLIHIRMVDLAREVNDSRLDVSIALNKMVGEGLLELGRGKIKILALEKFRI